MELGAPLEEVLEPDLDLGHCEECSEAEVSAEAEREVRHFWDSTDPEVVAVGNE